MAREPGRSKLLEFRSDTAKLRTHLMLSGALLLVMAILIAIVGESRIYGSFRAFVLAHPSIEVVLKVFSDYGNYVFYALFLAIGVLGLVRNKPELFFYSLAYLAVQIIAAALITRTVKIITARPRPDSTSGFSSLRARANSSFPSGHTSDMACSSSVLSYFLSSSVVRIALYLCLIMMGLSRVGLGEHHPFDVVGGAFVGLFVGYIVSHFFSTRFLPRTLSEIGEGKKKAPSPS